MSLLCLATPGLNPVFAARHQSGANDFALEHRLNAHATASAAGVVVEWTSGFETDTLGFNVYRISDGRIIKLNPGLLVGPALIATPRTQPYAWFDPAGAANSTYEVESVDLRGELLRRVVAAPDGRRVGFTSNRSGSATNSGSATPRGRTWHS
jgi:hypothetical protein